MCPERRRNRCVVLPASLHDKEWERLEMSSRKLEIPRANMSSIKDRNGVDLTEAEDINKRWQEYTE